MLPIPLAEEMVAKKWWHEYHQILITPSFKVYPNHFTTFKSVFRIGSSPSKPTKENKVGMEEAELKTYSNNRTILEQALNL